MAGRPVKFTQTHQAMAMARRLSHAGAEVFAALERSDDLAFSAHVVDDLCAPPDAAAVLKAVLKRKENGAEPGKRQRTSAPRLRDTAKAKPASERSKLSSVAPRSKPEIASAKMGSTRAVSPAFKTPQAARKPALQTEASGAKQARAVVKPTTHVAKTPKDIVDFRHAQRRDALDAQTQPQGEHAERAQAPAPMSDEKPKEGAAFETLAAFSRANAVATFAVRAKNVKGAAQAADQTVQTGGSVSLTGAVEKATQEDSDTPRPEAPGTNIAQGRAGHDNVARNAPERSGLFDTGNKANVRNGGAPTEATMVTRTALEPARPRARAKTARLPDGTTATSEAAWRNGVEPQ